jgi:hypothetical protein
VEPAVRPLLQMHGHDRLRDPVGDRRHAYGMDPAASKATRAGRSGRVGDPDLQRRHPRRPSAVKHSQALSRSEQTHSVGTGRGEVIPRPFRCSRVYPRQVANDASTAHAHMVPRGRFWIVFLVPT